MASLPEVGLSILRARGSGLLRAIIHSSLFSALFCLAGAAACTRTEAPSGAPQGTASGSTEVPSPPTQADPNPEEGAARPSAQVSQPSDASASAEPTPFALPPNLDTTQIVEVEVPLDLPVRVLHAEPPLELAIVYLHGMCSTSRGAEGWASVATKYGTLVMLRAETPCGDRPGNKWTKDTAILQTRIDRALEAVRATRGGHLTLKRLAILGYSQGAHRAELLVAAYPDRYPWVMLGGPPEAALPENFRAVERLAVFGGELEKSEHMQKGARRVAASGIPTQYFVLPKAYHGDFGPKGREVMQEVLSWALEAPAGVPTGTQ